VALHSSEAGRRFGRTAGTLALTDSLSERLIRLPMWNGMGNQSERVIAAVHDLVC
jgi:dTDP-4-amino-4,6-dideoxygalactose transaminase